LADRDAVVHRRSELPCPIGAIQRRACNRRDQNVIVDSVSDAVDSVRSRSARAPGSRSFHLAGVPCNPLHRWSPRGPPLRGAVRATVRHPFEPNQLPPIGVETEVGADWLAPRRVFLGIRRDVHRDETVYGRW